MNFFYNKNWTLNNDNGFIMDGNECIAQVFGATVHNHEDNRAKCFAYARLIAHAPELLRLLQNALENVGFQKIGLNNLEGDILCLLKDIHGKEIYHD